MYKPTIVIDQISKMYRIYKSPRYRMLDALGLPVPSSSYDEFWAIRNMSLSINAGERIGLIGRNGAGKSTLLKLIAGIIKPTSGKIKVNGNVQALMELGTGFHPELTGRKNVLSTFAYHGIVGKRANDLLEDVLDFSELDDFIDKPVKIYSSGMYSRLAFAASTAIKPDILIIDEILGAGDAYFAGKSVKRMKDLTAEGTTLLFVSHDISAVQMMCNRAIWIERGKILQDDNPIEVGRHYAASIRQQEELKLRAINLKISRGDSKELLNEDESEQKLVMRFISKEGSHPKSPLRIYKIALKHKEKILDYVTVGGSLDDDRKQSIHLLTAKNQTNWSPPKTDHNGLEYREFCDCNGSYGHAPLTLKLPLGIGTLNDFDIEITHGGASETDEILCDVFTNNEYRTVGTIARCLPGKNAPCVQNFSLAPVIQHITVDNKNLLDTKAFVYGNERAWIEKVDFFNHRHESQRVFTYNEPLTVTINWKAKERLEQMAFVITFYGMDGRCASQIISDFVSTEVYGISGSIDAKFHPLMIGAGDYILSIGIYDGKSETNNIDTPIYVQTRQHRIKIIAPVDTHLERGLVVHPVTWQSECYEN